ncbi:glutamyl-tRNA reductase [Phormidium tenue]|uniref:Glutamyl-tRNA reductase n=1 Tax=Phormidium tenue NIES-30 TaxID=549789 RepID=A0A1U7J789_9CYAN|nr:glutamyl-tRNA reductase [Phormidium tenue]MBD2231597.1 glutamyl-tRNA reductase [Phormidium tenue FACHB-1052]OKH49024.1 glutamyl-tRNA reductase [Phormidium tenue NIES-30]
MNIAVIGLSHKTAPVQIREKLSIPTAQTGDAIAHLTHCPHIDEVSILSTCNRLEIHIVTEETEQGIREVTQFLSEHSGLPLHELRQHLFILLHQDAVNHLMRVAAGLDSLVLGEGQILAQVKHAHQLAQQHKSIGRVLDRLLKQSLTAGKRVRSETSIGTGAVSISSAAVELARMKVPHLNSCHISILGAGKMARLLVQHLVSKDSACTITILNRTIDRANELAKQFPDANICTGTLDLMLETVEACDVVFTCTSATEPILDRDNLAPLVNNRTLMVFDISVPLNVHTNANELDNVHAFNVDDLKAVVAQNQASRRRMAMEAQVLLDQEVESFMDWWRSLDTVGTISSLRSKVETIREQELEKALSRLGSEFAEKHQEVIEALTRGIVNKILHDPMVQLRAQRDIEARKRAMQTLQVLFDLETTSNEKYS